MRKIIILLMGLFITWINASVIEFTDENFENKIKEHNRTIVMFSAPWCGACKSMKPTYLLVSESLDKEVIFASVNTDASQEIAIKYRITSIPTTIIFENGKEIKRDNGALNKVQLINMIDPKIEEKICNATDKQSLKMCFNIAHTYRYTIYSDDADPKAFKYFTQLCDNGDIDGCLELGYCYFHAKAVDRNVSKALELFDRACKNGKEDGCISIGIAYRDGNHLPQSYEKAVEIFQKACDNNSSFGCYHLARSYEAGNGVEKNGTKALLIQKEMCDGGKGDSYAYEESCNQVGQIYRNGNGVKKDYKEASKYYDLACDRGSAVGCSNLGYLYANGLGVDKNISQAISFYEIASKENIKSALTYLGDIYYVGEEVKQNLNKAKGYFEQLCDQDDDYGCYSLAYMYEYGEGGLKIDNRVALKLYIKGCKLGNEDACKAYQPLKKEKPSAQTTNIMKLIKVIFLVILFFIIPIIMHGRQKRVVLINREFNVIKEVPYLFSWSMFILGFFVPLSRKDWLWSSLTFVLQIATSGKGAILFAFFYNRIYIKSLIEQGYEPIDEASKALLDAKGIIYNKNELIKGEL